MELSDLLIKAEKSSERLIDWRRDFHQNPELGYQEFRTSEIVANHLKGLGLEVKTKVGKTGVIGLLRGEEPGPTIAIRADMDALPIQDEKEVSYRSSNSNVAHLCGHDAHTSMLMAAAELLTSLGKPKKGNIKFIFQPAEELLAGAAAMIADGVLEEPKVDAIIGLHVNPSLPVGKIGVTYGVACASVDNIKIKIIGKGGHGARPHEGRDSILIASQVVVALQNISSRMIDPLQPVVVSIGKIQGGSIGTALATSVEMEGTVRTLSPKIREKIPHLMDQVIKGVVSAFDADYELDYELNYPSLNNDKDLLDFISETSELVLGKEKYEIMGASTGGEDFSFYAEKIPGAFFRLGVGNGTQATSYPLHHPKFDLDESGLHYGVAMLAATAIRYLEMHNNNLINS
ncbi:M20 metallopeptidase family protein [Neobacillus sp. Marseille-QA0830]